MSYRMITRMEKENAGEKCPNCKFIGRSFLVVGDDLWACMDCGCVFVPKRKRLEIREKIAEEQKEKKDIVEKAQEEASLKCECGFVGKTEHGLKIHKLSCQKLS